MAWALTDHAEGRVRDFFRGVGSLPSGTWYVGLTTTAPTETGGGTEVSGGAYARVSFVWDTGTVTGSALRLKASAQVTFPKATAGWGTVVGAIVADALTAGNIWFYASLATAKLISIGGTARFNFGNLYLDID